MKRLQLLSFILVLALAHTAITAVPQTISYQGVLKDDTGAIVPDGEYTFTFKIYNVDTGGTPLWTEVQTIPVSAGILDAVLGAVNPIELNFDEQYWLGVTIGAGAELAPRTELTASPYALNAQMVRGGNLFPQSGHTGIGTTIPSHPLEIEGTVSDQVGIEYHGSNLDWASIYVNAVNASCKPGYGYLRQYTLRALTHLDTDDRWHVRILGSQLLSVKPDGNVGIGTIDPIEKLDVTGAVRIGNTAFSNTGTIRWTGADFEGYDGATWLSLTAGGSGSLPPGTSGQTLRHNGADWVANTFLYNDGSNIGVGTTTPNAPLNIAGGNGNLDITEGDFKIGDDVHKFKIGLTMSGDSAGTARVRIDGGVKEMIFGCEDEDALIIRNCGIVNVGTQTQSGSIGIYGGLGAQSQIHGTTDANGGVIYWRTEDGNYCATIKADTDGEGGELSITRDAGLYDFGFQVMGNYNATNDPAVFITGASRSASFNMNNSGNQSVSLPANAIYAYEMLDEPGTASNKEGLASVTLTGGWQAIISRSITVPTSGYVMVIGTCQPAISHTTGTTSSADFGVSDNDITAPDNQDVGLILNSGLPSGMYYFPATVHGLFEVGSAGTYTYYLLGRETSGNIIVYDTQLTLLYVPTAYGTVVPTLASGESVPDRDASAIVPMSAQDILAERLEAEVANRERMEREMAVMRAEFEELKQEIAREREGK
ncbi:MAG: hypothetical protein JSV33_12270 [bacterium]|nr:MAG: hypothetical protein JSV33_12270 [bacterium]